MRNNIYSAIFITEQIAIASQHNIISLFATSKVKHTSAIFFPFFDSNIIQGFCTKVTLFHFSNKFEKKWGEFPGLFCDYNCKYVNTNDVLIYTHVKTVDHDEKGEKFLNIFSCTKVEGKVRQVKIFFSIAWKSILWT